jgi:hypothetical protein
MLGKNASLEIMALIKFLPYNVNSVYKVRQYIMGMEVGR